MIMVFLENGVSGERTVTFFVLLWIIPIHNFKRIL